MHLEVERSAVRYTWHKQACQMQPKVVTLRPPLHLTWPVCDLEARSHAVSHDWRRHAVADAWSI